MCGGGACARCGMVSAAWAFRAVALGAALLACGERSRPETALPPRRKAKSPDEEACGVIAAVRASPIDEDAEGMTIVSRVGDANRNAAKGRHRDAAKAYARMLRSPSLAPLEPESEAGLLYNLASSLIELPDCLAEASSSFAKAAKIAKLLEERTRIEGDAEAFAAQRLSRAHAYIGVATAQRKLCAGEPLPEIEDDEAAWKHCEVARKHLRAAQRLLPHDFAPIVNEGNVLLTMGDPVRAANRYLAAARLDPSAAQAVPPRFREFVASRISDGDLQRDVESSMELVWALSRPRLPVGEDCRISQSLFEDLGGEEGEAAGGGGAASACTWKQIKENNPADLLQELLEELAYDEFDVVE